MTNIDQDDPHLYGYQTYTTSNDASFIGNHLDQSPHMMQMISYFAIGHFSCPDLVFKTIPCHPPDGFITEGFAISIILVIFGNITLRAWIQLMSLSSRRFLQRLILREMCAYHTKNWLIDQCNHTVSSLKNLAAYATALLILKETR
jgi:hypothetical protein